MAKKKENPNATELLLDPLYTEDTPKGSQDTPFDKAYAALMTTGGKYLEMMTRATPKLAQAISVSYNMMWNFRSAYIKGKIDTLMRIHVSMAGKGRAEMVQSLQSGSGVPGEFYDQGNGAMNSFVDVDEGIEEDGE